MKASRTAIVILMVLGLTATPRVQAQYNYSLNYQTNTISGIASNWIGNGYYVVGSNTYLNALVIQNGGALNISNRSGYNGSGYVGYEIGGSNNAVLVTGSGSVWSNGNDLYVGVYGAGNQLTIANGGRVVSGYGLLGVNISSSNNVALVTGSGSVWSNGKDLDVGENGAGNQLTISNGGQVVSRNGILGVWSSSSSNVVLVTGPGSVWSNGYNLYVGAYGAGNQLTVTNSGAVFANSLVLGQNAGSSGTLTLAGGTVNVVGLIVTNAGSAVVFNSGVVNSAGAAITNALTFADGDGVDAATYHMLGGVHSFANGLEIRNNASLTGCGTVTGNVVVDAGGTVLANCGGTLTFTGTVTNNGTVTAVAGTTINFSVLMVNYGTIVATNGAVNFLGGVVNNGTMLLPPNSWIDGNGKWETSTNWSSGTAPSASDFADLITNAGNKTVTIDAITTNTPSTMTISNLTVSAPSGSTNTLALSNTGTLSTPFLIKGAVTLGGGGVITVTNSALEVDTTGGGPAGVDALLVGVVGSGNTLAITNGGQVVNGFGYLGYNSGSSNNIALVTGAGSVWSNGNNLYVGVYGAGNQLTIANGGQAVDSDGYLGFNSSNNVALVTGPDSVWSNRTDLYVGYSGAGNQLTVSNSGAVFANNLVLGLYADSSATLTLAGGTVNITSLTIPNAGSAVVFNGGTLNTAGATISNNVTFADGDGLDAATYHLLGGIHSFANGLEIENNASLTGCGTVIGNVVVLLGGTVQADCGGTLTFTNNVTNNGTMRASNGSVLEAYGLVVNNGFIDITGGTTNFHGGFINNGVVCSQLTNTITTSSSPAGSGTISGDGTYSCGSSVTVCATPSSCYSFANWSDQNSNVVSYSSCYSFTAASDETLVANFTPIAPYTITTSSAPPNGGTTSGGGSVPCGSNVTVCATANPGYAFVSWSLGSRSNCYTFMPNGNASLTAYFGPFQITGLTVQGNGVRVTWIAPHGSSNVVYATNGGPGGGYSTNFLPVGQPIVMPAGPPTTGVSTNYLDVGGATNKPSRYYRVLLPGM